MGGCVCNEFVDDVNNAEFFRKGGGEDRCRPGTAAEGVVKQFPQFRRSVAGDRVTSAGCTFGGDGFLRDDWRGKREGGGRIMVVRRGNIRRERDAVIMLDENQGLEIRFTGAIGDVLNEFIVVSMVSIIAESTIIPAIDVPQPSLWDIALIKLDGFPCSDSKYVLYFGNRPFCVVHCILHI
jgi:hypothetical protein